MNSGSIVLSGRKFLAIGLLLTLTLTGCAFPSFTSTPTRIDQCLTSLEDPSLATGLFVEPDDTHAPVTDEIDAASCTIDISVYLLTDETVIASLENAERRGVQVRVMLEEHPYGGDGSQGESRQLLEDAGADVRWSGSDIRFSHAKYAVIDRRVALVMNQNLTASAFESNREFGIVTTDPEIVSQAQTLFDRDWAGDSITDSEGPLLISPLNSRSQLLQLIGEADRSIDFYAEVIRDQEIIEALGAAEARGVAVRLIVDQSMDEDTQEVAIDLFNRGVDIRISDGLYIHAKLMIIDGEAVVVGSQNFTMTSLDKNREVAVIATDPAILSRCMAVFEYDWERAIPGAPS